MTATLATAVQMQSWHEGGLFMGMHWAWWLFWTFTLLVIAWAFVRLVSDRSETHKHVGRKEAAEEALRRRFAAGEIDEDEYARRMKVLRDALPGG